MNAKCPVCQSDVQPTDMTCPSCNFKLSGATQRYTPVNLNGSGDSDKGDDREAVLKMVRGPQVGLKYPLNHGETTIGRNPQCDIFLNDMTVSRQHASITEQDGAHIINDMQSFNGVWVNNKSVERHTLRPGDYVQIGKYDFIYEETEEE